MSSHGGPSSQRRTLQTEKEKDSSEKAFNGTALAEFFFGPGGRETGAVFLAFGIPGDHGDCSYHAVNPGNQVQAPIGGIQTDHAGTDAIELNGPGEQWLSKRSVMDIGGRKEEEERQSRSATDERMNAIAS